MAIYGEGITSDTLSALQARLQDQGPLPHWFDIVNYMRLEHQHLKKHIDRVGVAVTDCRAVSKG